MSQFNLVIQLHPEESNSFLEYRKSLESWMKETKLIKNFIIKDHTADKEKFVNILLETNNIKEAFKSLKSILESTVDSNNHSTIVVACGENGWDDYEELYNNSAKEKQNKRKLH